MINEREMNQIIDKTLEFEGGYVNHRYDSGGETKFGISKQSYPQLDIKSLTKDWAKEIYERDFFKAQKLEQLNDSGLAKQIFDMTVNIGKYSGGRIVQQALNTCGHKVKIDGIIGDETIKALNRCKVGEVRGFILTMLLSHYLNLYDKNKNDASESRRLFYKDCLRSWNRRVLKTAEVPWI